MQPGWSIKGQHLRKYSKACATASTVDTAEKKNQMEQNLPQKQDWETCSLACWSGEQIQGWGSAVGEMPPTNHGTMEQNRSSKGEQGDKLTALEKGWTSLPCLPARVLEGAGPSGLLVASITSTMQKGSWHFWGGRGTLSGSG